MDHGRLISSDLQKLSDKKVIKRFCPDRADEEAGRELWHRHNETILESIKKVAKRRSFRPASCDYKSFVDATFTRAYLNFLNRICGYNFQGPIKHWLYKLALTTALDERRTLLGRGSVKLTGIEDAFPHQAPADVGFGFHYRHRGGFRTKLFPLHARHSTNPVEKIAAEERRFIVLELLVRHADSSDKNADSARTIRLYHWRKWSVPRIAEYFFSEAPNKQKKAAQEKSLYRTLQVDYAKLKALLMREFNIKTLREIV